MLKQQLHIQEPCAANWEAMAGEGATRFCDHCEKHVHGLSEMTRRQAEAVLDAAQSGRLCVRYLFDTRGRVRFEPKLGAATAPAPQARGARQLLAAGAALLGLLVGGPTVAGPSVARAESPGASAAPPTAEAPAPADVDITLEERIFDQERRAAQALNRYGLELEEEYLYDKAPDDAQLYLVIPAPDPYEYGHVAGGL